MSSRKEQHSRDPLKKITVKLNSKGVSKVLSHSGNTLRPVEQLDSEIAVSLRLLDNSLTYLEQGFSAKRLTSEDFLSLLISYRLLYSDLHKILQRTEFGGEVSTALRALALHLSDLGSKEYLIRGDGSGATEE